MDDTDETMGPDSVILIEEDKKRIYQSWSLFVIIKLFGKRLSHSYLKIELTDTWKPTEPITFIDLGKDFYIIKFIKMENLQKVLHRGPWFIAGHFLSVKRWEPNFVPDNSTLTYTVIWAHLPNSPLNFMI